MLNWIAVLYGIVASFVIGLISGLGLPFTDATLPVIGAGVTGVIAGGVAGYFAREGTGSGAVHGLLATTIGGLVVGLFLLLIGTIGAGIFGFSIGVFYLLYVIAYGLPGAIGGAIGGLIGPEETTVGRPTR